MTQSPETLDVSGLSINDNVETQENNFGAVDEARTVINPRIPTLSHVNTEVRQYLRDHVAGFRDLDDLRIKGWNSVEGDKHFKEIQQNADHADDNTKKKFYRMNKDLGKELDDKTQAFYVRKKLGAAVTSLNLCMAPGGYTWYFLERNPTASSFGITLATEDGGHPMYLPYGEDDRRVVVEFMDITMLASEFGTPVEDVPRQHPEADKFSAHRPFEGQVFDVVICDGQVLRVHQHQRSPTRETVRLLVSQLILGLQRIKLKTFEAFSRIQVYKSEKTHAGRSSFYLVAKNVQPGSPEGVEAVENWKKVWWRATFAGDSGTGLDLDEPNDEEIKNVLDAYGPRLRQLGEPIWSIQLKAMRKAPFMRNGSDSGRSAESPVGFSKRTAGFNRSSNQVRPTLGILVA